MNRMLREQNGPATAEEFRAEENLNDNLSM